MRTLYKKTVQKSCALAKYKSIPWCIDICNVFLELFVTADYFALCLVKKGSHRYTNKSEPVLQRVSCFCLLYKKVFSNKQKIFVILSFNNKKNPPHRRQRFSQPIWIVAHILKKNLAQYEKICQKKNFFVCRNFTSFIIKTF